MSCCGRAGQGRAQPAAGELDHRDQSLGAVEAVRTAGQDTDMSVRVLRQGTGDAGVEGVTDRVVEAAQLAGQVHHLRNPGPGRPGDHPGQQTPATDTLDPEHFPQLFLDEVGAVQRPVRLPDHREGLLLPAGQVAGVLQHRPPGSLQCLGLLVPAVGLQVAGDPAADLVDRLAGQATTWKESRHSTAFGALTFTTGWIQSAPSQPTCVNAAARSVPSAAKNASTVAWERPSAAHTTRPVSTSVTTVMYR